MSHAGQLALDWRQSQNGQIVTANQSRYLNGLRPYLSLPLSLMALSPLKISHFFDYPSQWSIVARYMSIRGWCFREGNSIQAIRLRAANLTINGVVGKFRPDVKAAFPSAPDDWTGFEIHAFLPSGLLELSIEAQFADKSWHLLLERSVNVQRRWRPLWLGGGDCTELMFSQVPCHIQYPPRILTRDSFPASTTAQNRRPKLTVITPSFQQARYLPDTLRSVFEQTGTQCEYVVQDGGSTDGSDEIICNFAKTQDCDSAQVPRESKTRLTSWVSEPDAGQADAIARGFAKTSGGPNDLMAWINSDDFYLPGTFAFVADFFARHPEVDVIYGHRLLIDEKSCEIGRWFLPEHDDEVLKLYDFVPQETMFWRRRIWDKVGGIDPYFKFAMDWDLLLRFQAAGARIVRVPYFLACFRIHPAQKTSAQMEAVGQREIDTLRARTFGRQIPPAEIETDPKLLRYLRRSAWLRFLWRLGIRK